MGILEFLFRRKAADDLDPAEAKSRQAEGAIIVDVREPEEWRSGHAPGARNIPLGQIQKRLKKLPKDRDLIFVCRSGNRSRQATNLAKQHGLARSLNLRGGMGAWSKVGLSVER